MSDYSDKEDDEVLEIKRAMVGDPLCSTLVVLFTLLPPIARSKSAKEIDYIQN
jgi:hypothetical protein